MARGSADGRGPKMKVRMWAVRMFGVSVCVSLYMLGFGAPFQISFVCVCACVVRRLSVSQPHWHQVLHVSVLTKHTFHTPPSFLLAENNSSVCTVLVHFNVTSASLKLMLYILPLNPLLDYLMCKLKNSGRRHFFLSSRFSSLNLYYSSSLIVRKLGLRCMFIFCAGRLLLDS